MTDYIALQVAKSDAASLDSLKADLADDVEMSTAQPFDGEVVAQLILGITSASVPVIIAWIKSQASARKSYHVMVDGVQLSGYTPDEVSRIAETIQRLGGKEDAP